MSIRFACSKCQHSLKVPDELAGKRAKCPHCSSTVDVPGGVNHAVTNKAAANKAVAVATPTRPPSAEFIGLDKPVTGPGAGKPYRRNRGNPVMKLMILVLLLGVLAGGGYAAIQFKLVDGSSLMAKIGLKSAATAPDTKAGTDTAPQGTRKATTTQPQTTQPKEITPAAPLPDAHFLPDGTVAIASLNLESLLNSKLYDKAKDEFAKQDVIIDKAVDMQIKPFLGAQFAAISRVVAGSAGGEDSVLIVRPRNPVTIDEIKLNKKGDYKEVKVGKFTMHEGPSDAYCLAEERMLVLGPPALLKKILERDKPVELKPDLDAAYKRLATAKTVAVAFTPAETQKELGKLPGGMGFKPPPEFEPAVQGKAFVLQLDLAQGLEVSANLTCKDAEAATALKKAIDTSLASLKEELEKIKKDKEGMPEEKQARKLEEILGQLKVAVEGPTVSATLALNNENTAAVFEAVKQFIMGMRAGQ